MMLCAIFHFMSPCNHSSSANLTKLDKIDMKHRGMLNKHLCKENYLTFVLVLKNN